MLDLSLDYLQRSQPQIINLNLGSGEGTSVLQLIKIFEVSNDVKINYIFKERRKGDSAYLTASIQKAKKMINLDFKNQGIVFFSHNFDLTFGLQWFFSSRTNKI